MAKHLIELAAPDVRPFNSASYRAGAKPRKLEKAKIYKMLCMNLKEPVQSEWAPPVLFTPKKDGSLRLCLSYKKLKGVKLKDAPQSFKWTGVWTL